VGRDGLFDILRQERLLLQPQRAYHKTTNSHHRFRRHPNLLREYKTPDAVHWAFLQQ
jgi:putative transposase